MYFEEREREREIIPCYKGTLVRFKSGIFGFLNLRKL